MHFDFVAEGYQKRCAALKFAVACKDHVIKNKKEPLKLDQLKQIKNATPEKQAEYPEDQTP